MEHLVHIQYSYSNYFIIFFMIRELLQKLKLVTFKAIKSCFNSTPI